MNRKLLYLTLAFVAVIQGVLLWADHHPMFFFGDSASYICKAVAGWLPFDRSFQLSIHLVGKISIVW